MILNLCLLLNGSENVLKTKKYQNHIPHSAGYYLKSSYEKSLNFYHSYRGYDCMDWFALQMHSLAKSIKIE